MSIQKITFKSVLDFLATKKSNKWFVVLQASQFELNGFKDSTNFGTLTLNFGPEATRDMELHDDRVTFRTRKHGVDQWMSIPYTAIMIFQDPDDPMTPIAWPYYLDHGDDYVEEPSNVVAFTPREAWDEAGRISAQNYLDIPEVKEHSDGAKVIDMVEFRNKRDEDPILTSLKAGLSEMGLLNDSGSIDLFKVAESAQLKTKAEKPLTLEEKVGLRKWVVIDGGKQPPKASLPVIDEIYRAKQAKREAERNNLKINLGNESGKVNKEIRSDGNDGTSVFFPDLDVSKCYFPTKRIERPTWLKVIDGGKVATVAA